LHDCNYHGGTLFIKVNDFVYRHEKLFVFNKCSWLTTKNECKYNNLKPRLCEEMVFENFESDKFETCPTCLFKYKRLLK